MKRYSEFLIILFVGISLYYLNGNHLTITPPKNMSNIASALASVFGSLVGFSIAALGIVFAIVQKKEYDALFKYDHAETFFRAFKNNQLISFMGFIVNGVAMIDDFSKDIRVCILIISIIVGWIWSFFRLVTFFNSLVDAEINVRKKQRTF